ncbi:MAG: methylase domain protein [Verrucomicrobiales bacterium]|nr:methylase domain protein [Verrucomicrobiales bacterium]
MQLRLFESSPRKKTARSKTLAAELLAFDEFGEKTRQSMLLASNPGGALEVPVFINEFWTAKQRAASSLHEVSYRACFKPQLPRFFIERLTKPGDKVYDPFMGRGTTPLEAALLGRVPVGCDVNPLSAVLVKPRLNPPSLAEIAKRLDEIDFGQAEPDALSEDLLVFYHPDTLRQILALKQYLIRRRKAGKLDSLDEWICMVAINRLTGHSPGFFSVYTLPPNQATSLVAQRKINEKRKQTPPARNVAKIILKKSKALLSDCDEQVAQRLRGVAGEAKFLTGLCAVTPQIQSGSIHLVVTSPPFLDIVDYVGDNWLRCWFLGVDAKSVQITMAKKVEQWQTAMTEVFKELHRVLAPGGHVAFEVGEVRHGKVKLEEAVLPCGLAAGLEPALVLINDQEFTKTANCWGVDNNDKGTNTNRIVLFRKA